MHSGTIQYIMPNSGTYQFLAGRNIPPEMAPDHRCYVREKTWGEEDSSTPNCSSPRIRLQPEQPTAL